MIAEHKTSDLKPTDLRPTLEFSKEGVVKPFHEALIPHGMMLVNEFERSFSTKLGSTFEESARLIASDFHSESIRSRRITGNISANTINLIEKIKNEIDRSGMKQPYPEIVSDVVKASLITSEQRVQTQIADLYIKDKKQNEIFFEIKSPKPNKGQCLEVTERLLHIHAVKHADAPRVRTYFAMAYNPYGSSKASYTHSFTLRYLDIKNEVLIGKEFWDLVGGKGTYEEVLEIYREVGREKGPDMIEQLALNSNA